MKYYSIPEFTRAEMDLAVSENDIEKLIYVPVFAALYYEDRAYALALCLKLSNHLDPSVRANAIEGFDHFARLDRKLDEEIIKPIIIQALEDENETVRDRADQAKDSTKEFLKWKYKK